MSDEARNPEESDEDILDENDFDGSESATESEAGESAGDESAIDGEDSADEDDGFSLEALSAAYARAVAEQNRASGESDSEESSTHDVDDESVENLDDETFEDEPDAVLDEEADNAPCEISPKSILESMLFVGTPDGSPMKNRNLAALMRGVSPKEVTQLTHELNSEYEAQDSPYRIRRESGGYKMVLADSFEPVRQKFYGEIKEARLSQPAIDVLSVVAYNQPATKEQVEKIRGGKPSGSILLQLVRRELLSRRKTEDSPKQTLFETTERFLELFGLDNIEDLPQTQSADFVDQ